MRQSRHKIVSEGFSLVELIIVIAIMAIMTGGVALSINMLRSADSKKLANELNSGFTTLRSENMATDKQLYMHLYWYDDKYYMQMTDQSTPSRDGSGTEIGSGSVSVTFKGENDITISPGSTEALSFSMKKKNGAFVESVTNDTNETKLKATTEIVVSSDVSEYTLVLVRDTGRHFFES